MIGTDETRLNSLQNEFIDESIKTILADYNEEEPKVRVLCYPPGIGKTTSLKLLIDKVLSDEKLPAIIVVTDLVNALSELAAGHMDQVAFLTADTLRDQIQTIKDKKVLMMTTQRYFNMDDSEFRYFFSWQVSKRKKVVIDEKALIFNQRSIDIENLNNIDTALVKGIDNINQTEKEWCVLQWRRLREHLESVANKYENKCDGRLEVWHKDEWRTKTEDDDRFERFVNKYSSTIREIYPQTFDDLKAINQLIRDGSLFQCQKRSSRGLKAKERYHKSFSVISDNSDKLTQPHNYAKADVFILDATGDLTAEYKLPYFKIIKSEKYDPNLSSLTIEAVDINTSKQAIGFGTKGALNKIDSIKQTLENAKVGGHKLAVFTYAMIEKDFSATASTLTIKGQQIPMVGHFGSLHGRNDFKNCDIVAHVGLNRLPNINYFLLDSMISPHNDFEDIKKLQQDQQIIRLDKWLSAKGEITRSDTMMESLLADFEQNIFRSSIRKYDGTPTKIYLFCDFRIYKSLLLKIRKRYEPLGATIIKSSKPVALGVQETMDRAGNSNSKIIIKWLQTLKDGQTFKMKELCDSTVLTNTQVRNARLRNKSLNIMFYQMETNRRGYYKINKKLLPL